MATPHRAGTSRGLERVLLAVCVALASSSLIVASAAGLWWWFVVIAVALAPLGIALHLNRRVTR